MDEDTRALLRIAEALERIADALDSFGKSAPGLAGMLGGLFGGKKAE